MIERRYQSGPKEGTVLDPRAVSFIETYYGKDWNNYHESAAEEIAAILERLDQGKRAHVRVAE